MAGSLNIKNANGKTGTVNFPDTVNSDVNVDIDKIVVKDANGNVGIGTSSPNTNIHLAANLPSITFSSPSKVNNWYIGANESDAVNGGVHIGSGLNIQSGTPYLLIHPIEGVVVKQAVGLGYGTGAGGTVTQLTSKSTAVTLNKPTGIIIMNNAALAAGASVTFILNNTAIGVGATTNVLVYIPVSSPNYAYYEVKSYGGANGVYIVVKNISAGSLSDAVQINFELIIGAAA